MSNKPLDSDLEKLVIAYQSARSAYIAEQYLDLLAERSNAENFQAVIDQMYKHPKLHELDISLYINEISKSGFTLLLPLISKLRNNFKDKDALEDLDEAEQKVRKQCKD